MSNHLKAGQQAHGVGMGAVAMGADVMGGVVTRAVVMEARIRNLNPQEEVMLGKPFQQPVRYLTVALPILGYTCIVQTDQGVCALFWRREQEALTRELKELFPYRKKDEEAPFVRQAGEELTAYCAGELQKFSVPLDLQGTHFRQRVWDVLLTIPYGTTLSYYAVACAIDNPKGVRAVAQACGANPVGIMVPCHRVIGKNGKLTGYASGLDYKQRLLELEGVLENGETRRLPAQQIRLPDEFAR